MYGQKSINTCTTCHVACSLCFGPLSTQCTECQPDLLTGNYYYLSYNTNKCIQVCPYGQYAVNGTYRCELCDINCATCEGSAKNCLSCTYINTISIVYLFNNKCITVCPKGYWMNSSVILDHQCTDCHARCTVCYGPSFK